MYQAQSFDHPRGLAGISDGQIAEHLELYVGYVKQVKKHVSGKDFGLSEGTRRLAYEYDGMVLHEQYFSNLKPGGARGRRTVSPAAAPSRRRTARSTAGRRTSRRAVACAAWAGSSSSRIP